MVIGIEKLGVERLHRLEEERRIARPTAPGQSGQTALAFPGAAKATRGQAVDRSFATFEDLGDDLPWVKIG